LSEATANFPTSHAKTGAIIGARGWNWSCANRCMPLPVLVGRGLAFAAHPAAAWTRVSRGGRAAIVASYALAAYAIVLTALLLFA
jgi:hypothetical protein